VLDSHFERQAARIGDPCQLPPAIKSKKAEKGLGKTMFERLMELYDDDNKHEDTKISRMLTVQYRMNEQIANRGECTMPKRQAVCVIS
jgi:hypothetical protein